MARTVKEWIGKTDNSSAPTGVKRRILERQGKMCALTSISFDEKNKPEFDHKVALWLGGENREGNLHAISKEAHKAKTAAEATVRAKVNRQQNKNDGITEPKGTLKGKGFAKPEKPAKTSSKTSLPPRAMFASAPAQERLP